MVALGTPFVRGRAVGRGVEIETGGDEPMRTRGHAGCQRQGARRTSDRRRDRGMPAEKIPRLHLAKGNYFSLSLRTPFYRLIYTESLKA